METLVRRAMLLPLVAFSVAACSDDGPSGPQVPAGSGGISGQLTASAAAIGAALGLADGDDDFFIGSATLANVTVEITDAAGVAVFSTDTDGAGRFTSDLSPGTYTIVVTLDDGSELSFVLEVAEGEMLFVRGKVDLNPSGKLKINLKIFHDQDGDGEADDNFTIRITGREAGQPSSGTTDAETLGAADKVVVCHAPPGNPDNEHTIVVGPSAEQAHLNHGDEEGPCEGDLVDGEPDGDLVDGDGDGDGDGSAEKVLVCHIPPGNPDNARAINISVDALEAHLAHGDIEGECPVDGDSDGGGT
jgi:hypothetical protein